MSETTNSVAPAWPAVSLNRDLGVKLCWFCLLLLPTALWTYTTDIYNYYAYGAPAGQLWYVYSKLFGLNAGLFLWLQGVTGLLQRTRYTFLIPPWSIGHHRLLGAFTACLIIAHVACFVTAASIRKQTVALDLLLPNFTDFYHGAITVGWFGLVLLFIAITAAIRGRFYPHVWRYLHRMGVVCLLLALGHGYLIGSETRYGLYQIFYSALIITVVVAVAVKIREKTFDGVRPL